MADVKDILGVPRGGLSSERPEQKEKKEKMKRPEGMSREAFALLGDSHPIVPSHIVDGLKRKRDMKQKPKASSKGNVTYQWKQFHNPARTDILQLSHWVKGYKDVTGRVRDADEGEYTFAKFNKKVHCYKYDDEEYESLVKKLSTEWTREETDYLIDMCERFDLRFPIIADRYEYGPGVTRSVEDLKDRYYSIARALLVAREGNEAAVANQVIIKYPYNCAHEKERKRALHVLLTRTPKQLHEENVILTKAKAIEEHRQADLTTKLSAPSTNLSVTEAKPAKAPSPQPMDVDPVSISTSEHGAAPSDTPKTASSPTHLPQPATTLPVTAAPTPTTPAALLSPTKPPGLLESKQEFSNDTGHGLASLIASDLQPFRPPKPGVYARGAFTREQALAMTNAMAGGSRAHKAVEGFLNDLGWTGAIFGPRVCTRAVCGAWLAMRSEVVQMLDMKRNLQNRHMADEGRKRPEKRKK